MSIRESLKETTYYGNLQNITSLESLCSYNVIGHEGYKWDIVKNTMSEMWKFIKTAILKMYDFVRRIITGFRYKANIIKRRVEELYVTEDINKNVDLTTDVCWTTRLFNPSMPIPNPEQQIKQYNDGINQMLNKLKSETIKPNLKTEGLDWNAVMESFTIKKIENYNIALYGGNYVVGVEKMNKKTDNLTFKEIELSDDFHVMTIPLLSKTQALTILNAIYKSEALSDKLVKDLLKYTEIFCKDLASKGVGHQEAAAIKSYISKLYPFYLKTMTSYLKDSMELVEKCCDIVKELPTNRTHKLSVRYFRKDKTPSILNP